MSSPRRGQDRLGLFGVTLPASLRSPGYLVGCMALGTGPAMRFRVGQRQELRSAMAAGTSPDTRFAGVRIVTSSAVRVRTVLVASMAAGTAGSR
jgi:hypothetical protein